MHKEKILKHYEIIIIIIIIKPKQCIYIIHTNVCLCLRCQSINEQKKNYKKLNTIQCVMMFGSKVCNSSNVNSLYIVNNNKAFTHTCT